MEARVVVKIARPTAEWMISAGIVSEEEEVGECSVRVYVVSVYSLLRAEDKTNHHRMFSAPLQLSGFLRRGEGVRVFA